MAFEVARLLRQQAQGHELRLIALTADREHAGREPPRMAGFEGQLLKPVAADDLASLFPHMATETPVQAKITGKDRAAAISDNGISSSRLSKEA